jgi:anti-sigma B factor antagonist
VQSDNPGNVVRLATAADGLRVDRVEHDSALVYRVAGEVDTLTAPHLDLALTDPPATAVSRVVLDLTEVPFLSSAGLSILVEHHTACQRHGIAFAVVAPAHAVRRAMEITALDRVIPLYDSVPAALLADG